MFPENLLDVSGFALQMLFGVLMVFAVLGLRVFFFWRRLFRRRQEIRDHKAAGTIAPAGFLDGQPLPRHYDALASIGIRGEAPMTLDDRILRPSIGVRLFVLGLFGAILGYMLWPDVAPGGFNDAMLELPVPLIATQSFLAGAGLWGVLYIFGFEARYNRDTLILTRLLVVRREYHWKHLVWLKDNGAYELVLTFEPGGKAKILKHCAGIEDFKAFAVKMAQRNLSTHA